MSFLLIFVFLNASILKNAAFFTSKQKSFISHIDSKRILQNKFEKYKYKTYHQNQKKDAKDKVKKIAKALPKKTTLFISHRLKENISPLGKWNLTALFQANTHSSALLKTFTENLLIDLYGDTSFWKETEKQVPHLATAFVKAFLRKEKAVTLVDLFPEEALLQNAFYKMLKGSGTYQILPKQGYPPLEAFFCVQKEEEKATYLAHAPYPILKALFKESALEKILTLEKQKWEQSLTYQSIKKEELQWICKENALTIPGKPFQDLEPLIHFSTKYAKLDKLTVHDKKAHIHLEMKVP